jgi:hypothetical protein
MALMRAKRSQYVGHSMPLEALEAEAERIKFPGANSAASILPRPPPFPNTAPFHASVKCDVNSDPT